MESQSKDPKEFSDMSSYPQNGYGVTEIDRQEMLERRLAEESEEEIIEPEWEAHTENNF